VTDDPLIQQAFEAAEQPVAAIFAERARRGLQMDDLAVLIERRFDDALRTGVGSREELMTKLAAAGIAQGQLEKMRAAIHGNLRSVVAVIIVERGEGEIVVAIRHLETMTTTALH